MEKVDTLKYSRALRSRMERHGVFQKRREAGDLLAHVGFDRGINLNLFLHENFRRMGVEKTLDPDFVPGMMAECIAKHRLARGGVLAVDDDMVPATIVYWGIGGITAAMTGLDPVFGEDTTWLDTEMEWDEIGALRFNPSDKWVQFALNINQALWNLWEEDFHIMPFLHRSPLDAALGIRGSRMYGDIYDEPGKVKALLDWCVDWQLSMESFLEDNAGRPETAKGWGRAAWGVWIPDKAVFVNGDPVGLISRETAIEFEQPYTGRLFTSSGGGLFHNHMLGAYQADLVSSTPGTLVQYLINDPRIPTGTEALLDHPDLRDTIISASLKAPVAISSIPPERLDAVIDVAKQGRFILDIACDAFSTEAGELVKKIRKASNLK